MKISSITQWLTPPWVKKPWLPRICTLCNQYHLGDDAICAACSEFLVYIPSACTLCALPLPKSNFMICGDCIKKKPYFERTIAPYAFEEPLRTLIHEFKYDHQFYLLSFLAKLIINHLPSDARQTECLLPVPMHPTRLRQRGFNQATELTKYIGRVLNIPYNHHYCQKILPTLPQANLNAEQRKKNLQHSFHVNPMNYKHVTLVDDLLTTGSTANELAKILKQQGVQQVSVWCCARTIPKTEPRP